MALAAGSKHVPYRDSKLTFLLKNSLGGDARLLAFVCVCVCAYVSVCICVSVSVFVSVCLSVGLLTPTERLFVRHGTGNAGPYHCAALLALILLLCLLRATNLHAPQATPRQSSSPTLRLLLAARTRVYRL
jgi:hypothetical protein